MVSRATPLVCWGVAEVVTSCDHLAKRAFGDSPGPRAWPMWARGSRAQLVSHSRAYSVDAAAYQARAVATTTPIRADAIERRILAIRGQRVIVDADLAELYGVQTRRLNEQVKRNRGRFPQDFAFQLTAAEREEVVANCDHLSRLKFSPTLPYAFTEHGAIMAANVLNSALAVAMSVRVVRAFVRLREMIASHKELGRKLNELEQRVSSHDAAITSLVRAIRELAAPPEVKPRRRIGFIADD